MAVHIAPEILVLGLPPPRRVRRMAAPALLPLEHCPAATKSIRLDRVKERGRFIEGQSLL